MEENWVEDNQFKQLGYRAKGGDTSVIVYTAFVTFLVNGKNKSILPQSRENSSGQRESQNMAQLFENAVVTPLQDVRGNTIWIRKSKFTSSIAMSKRER